MRNFIIPATTEPILAPKYRKAAISCGSSITTPRTAEPRTQNRFFYRHIGISGGLHVSVSGEQGEPWSPCLLAFVSGEQGEPLSLRVVAVQNWTKVTVGEPPLHALFTQHLRHRFGSEQRYEQAQRNPRINLIVLAIACMAGVVIADLVGVRAELTWPLVGVGLLFGVVGLLIRRRTSTQPLAGPNWAAHLVLACAAATLAAARLAAVQIVDTPQGIWHLADTGEVVVQGWVSSDPKRSEDGQQLVLQVEFVRAGSRSRPQSGLVLVALPVFPERHYGDRLVLTGKLSTPRRPGSPRRLRLPGLSAPQRHSGAHERPACQAATRTARAGVPA